MACSMRDHQSLLTSCLLVYRITYATGEFEEVDLDEMVRDGHMTLL